MFKFLIAIAVIVFSAVASWALGPPLVPPPFQPKRLEEWATL